MAQRIGDALADVLNVLGNDGRIARYAGDISRLQIELNRLQAMGEPASPRSVALLSEQTASSSASLDFSGWDVSYRYYVIALRSILVATNNVSLQLRYSTDLGATFINTATYSYHCSQLISSSAAYAASALEAQTSIVLTAAALDNGIGLQGEIKLFNLPASQTHPITWDLATRDSSVHAAHFTGAGYNTTASPVNAIRLLPSFGNITSGTATLYGVP